MRIAFALILAAVAACSGPTKKTEPVGNEGSAVPEECCCTWSPLTSDDGKPVYEHANRMECSSKQGQCVDDVQCNASDSAAGSGDESMP